MMVVVASTPTSGSSLSTRTRKKGHGATCRSHFRRELLSVRSGQTKGLLRGSQWTRATILNFAKVAGISRASLAIDLLRSTLAPTNRWTRAAGASEFRIADLSCFVARTREETV